LRGDYARSGQRWEVWSQVDISGVI
jgi:hypothetical protein